MKLPNGRTLTGHSHDYKRNGTSTLFAAFEVATGKVKAAHKKRRRRKEFLDFMDEVVATYPKKRLEVILDNLNTHKKNEEWLARHPLVTFHDTPTRASWLNQVECWFSILQGQSLGDASFTSVEQLKEHIDAFIERYNEDAEPFVWTKSKVHQRRVKGRRLSDLRFRVLALQIVPHLAMGGRELIDIEGLQRRHDLPALRAVPERLHVGLGGPHRDRVASV